jgi:hypothetical protein
MTKAKERNEMSVGCPTCGTEVQPDWDWCHACGFDPESKRPPTSGRGAPPVQRSSGPQQLPAGRGPAYGGAHQPDWGPSPGPPSTTGKIVGIVVAVVLLAVCLPVVAILGVTFLGRASSSKASPATTDEDGGHAVSVAEQPWTKTTGDDGSFSFEMPGTPKKDVQNDTSRPGFSFTTTTYELATSDYDMVFGSLKLPPGTSLPADPGPLLESALGETAKGLGASIDSKDPSAFAGNPARQFNLSKAGYTGRCLAFVAGGTRVILACVLGSPTLDEPTYQKLLAGIQLT